MKHHHQYQMLCQYNVSLPQQQQHFIVNRTRNLSSSKANMMNNQPNNTYFKRNMNNHSYISNNSERQSSPEIIDFNTYLYNENDTFENLISKNNSLRLLIIKSSKKINSLLDKQTEMENDFKLEKQTIVQQLDQISDNYKLYANSHKQLNSIQQQLKHITNEYSQLKNKYDKLKANVIKLSERYNEIYNSVDNYLNDKRESNEEMNEFAKINYTLLEPQVFLSKIKTSLYEGQFQIKHILKEYKEIAEPKDCSGNNTGRNIKMNEKLLRKTGNNSNRNKSRDCNHSKRELTPTKINNKSYQSTNNSNKKMKKSSDSFISNTYRMSPKKEYDIISGTRSKRNCSHNRNGNKFENRTDRTYRKKELSKNGQADENNNTYLNNMIYSNFDCQNIQNVKGCLKGNFKI